ncbi:MAG: hypothetical protein AABW90_02395 [Nanoarchaeota archaeon]
MKEGIFSSITLTKIKAVILSIIIAIVLAGFVIYLVQSFDPTPKWDDYCGKLRPAYEPKPIGEPGVVNQKECEAQNGTWINNYCDYYYECQNKYNNASDKHKNIVFIVSVPVGLIAVGIGIMLALPSVSSGLMLGGGILTIYGVSQYWENLSNWIRTLMLGVVLTILIWFAYKKLKI